MGSRTCAMVATEFLLGAIHVVTLFELPEALLNS
jgi:hypothetical protein